MEGYISDSVYVANKKRNSLINRRIICRVLGVLLLVEVCMLLACTGVAWGYGEQDGLAFLLSAGITALAAGLLLLAGRKAERRMSKRDGYCVAALTWVLFSFFGMLPFLLSHSVPTVADAFFETMSGFTTTGATIMDDIDSQSHAILFWRALTHWIGGLGIVFFAIAILPAFSEGGNLQLFSAEAVGVTHDKIHPKVSTMARWLWTIYLILTVSQTILLWLGGMGWFDSVCQTFATLATGGFSTKQASIAYWNSPYIEYVTAIFMVLAGINFSLYFSCLKGKFGKIWRDEETRWFLGSILVLTLCIAAALVLKNDYGIEEAFRKAFFQVVTLHTSTGFATDDYMLWPSFTWVLLIFAMLAGGCTGSTSGGIKNLRLLIMSRGIRNHFRKLLHPNAVMQIRVNRQAVSSSLHAVHPGGMDSLHADGRGLHGGAQRHHLQHGQRGPGPGRLWPRLLVERPARGGQVAQLVPDVAGTSGDVRRDADVLLRLLEEPLTKRGEENNRPSLPSDYRRKVFLSPGVHEASFRRSTLSPIFNCFRRNFPFSNSKVTSSSDTSQVPHA